MDRCEGGQKETVEQNNRLMDIQRGRHTNTHMEKKRKSNCLLFHGRQNDSWKDEQIERKTKGWILRQKDR